MPIQKDGKTYYTQEELDKIVQEHIKKSAEDLRKEFKKIKLEYKQETYV
jgi:hypothetical protein